MIEQNLKEEEEEGGGEEEEEEEEEEEDNDDNNKGTLFTSTRTSLFPSILLSPSPPSTPLLDMANKVSTFYFAGGGIEVVIVVVIFIVVVIPFAAPQWRLQS